MDLETVRPDPTAPGTLLVAAAAVALEGLVSVGFGVAEAVHTTGERIAMGASTALFFVGFGAGLVVCAWGLTRLHTWARGPVLLAQLIALGLAWNFRGADSALVSVGFALPAVVVLVAMLLPATIAALNEFPDDPDAEDAPADDPV